LCRRFWGGSTAKGIPIQRLIENKPVSCLFTLWRFLGLLQQQKKQKMKAPRLVIEGKLYQSDPKLPLNQKNFLSFGKFVR